MHALDVVMRWQEVLNQQDIETLRRCSAPEIEIVGPRGSAHGHQVLLDWVRRAGARFETGRLFAAGGRVVAEQHGIWQSAETAYSVSTASVATSFWVQDGQVARVARFPTLEEALRDAELTLDDEYDPAEAR